MRHVFRATRMGWNREQDIVWFDTDQYTEEQARAEFKSFQDTTQKGYLYTGYEYDGVKYHDFTYLGEFENDQMPQNTNDCIEALIKRKKAEDSK